MKKAWYATRLRHLYRTPISVFRLIYVKSIYFIIAVMLYKYTTVNIDQCMIVLSALLLPKMPASFSFFFSFFFFCFPFLEAPVQVYAILFFLIRNKSNKCSTNIYNTVDCLFPQETWYRENKTKYRSSTRRRLCHVWYLYRTWVISGVTLNR